MNAAIDTGNQRVKVACFEKGAMRRSEVFHSGDWPAILGWLTNHRPENIILSTVGPPPDTDTEAALRSIGRLLKLEADTPLPIGHRYETPETLGKDRLAALVGAFDLYPGEACLVVDAGTCITLDVLDREGVFLGGRISPGVAMRLKAMYAFTARLPLLAPEWREEQLGRSTRASMLLGAQGGAALEIDALARQFHRDYGIERVLLTGGDANFLAKALKSKIFVHQNLVLQGLHKILVHNVEQLA